MSLTVSVEEAALHLKELIDTLAPGDEVVLTDNHTPVAKLVGERLVRKQRPMPGLGKGSILYMAADFDAPMDEFKEYTE